MTDTIFLVIALAVLIRAARALDRLVWDKMTIPLQNEWIRTQNAYNVWAKSNDEPRVTDLGKTKWK